MIDSSSGFEHIPKWKYCCGLTRLLMAGRQNICSDQMFGSFVRLV